MRYGGKFDRLQAGLVRGLRHMAAVLYRRTPTDAFDEHFYRANYKDLVGFRTRRELRGHYNRHGRQEGRFPNLVEAIDYFERSYGTLPSQFDSRAYINAHEDLRALAFTDVQAIEHYLKWGRKEGRAYCAVSYDIYREFYFKGRIVSDQEVIRDLNDHGFAQSRICTGADIMSLKGLSGGGKWIEAIKIDEFSLLNSAWAGPVSTRMQAVDAMLEKGIELLAPVASALQFDPKFYKELHPELKHKSPEQCYCHWLFVGFERNEPGSAIQFFDELGLALVDFPSAFRWKRYIGLKRFFSDKHSRWSAIRDYVVDGFAKHVSSIAEGDDAGAFLNALGIYYLPINAALSVQAFERAVRMGVFEERNLESLAEAYLQLRKFECALDAFESAARQPASDYSVGWKGAQIALQLGRVEQAFALLKTTTNMARTTHWRIVLHSAIEREFEITSSAARELIGRNQRLEADRLLTRAVSKVVERIDEFDPLDLPLPSAPDGKVVILANMDLAQCVHYRVEQKGFLLRKLGRSYRIYSENDIDEFISAIPGAAAVIFHRIMAKPKNVRAIRFARAIGIPTYYDIDDLVFDQKEYPEPFETYGAINSAFYELLQYSTALFREAIALCDYGIASTTVLAAHMEPLVQKHEAFVLPNGLDQRNLAYLIDRPKRIRRDDSIVIFYGSGTKAHNTDFIEMAGPSIKYILNKYRHVRLVIAGYLALDASFDAFGEQIVCVGWLPNINSYWSLLAEADINIAVLAPGATTDAKSEIKWLEAAALGIPSVVSGTARYREVLEDGVDVIIANSPDEWTTSLERLVIDADLREHIAQNACLNAELAYAPAVIAEKFEALLPRMNVVKKEQRVLIVNTHFYPQSLGGSATVVRDNIDCFLDDHAHAGLKFGVVTTEFNGDGSNRIHVENYRNCPVFRINADYIDKPYWRPKNTKAGKKFRDILDFWQPDLVHFHCVEVLSATFVEICRSMRIPYLTSLHDAWWISDWHFLTDNKQCLRAPFEPFPIDPPPPADIGDALSRRRYLAELLNDSYAILGVSDSIAEIHRNCGFDRAVAVPNGVRSMYSPRRSTTSGRVRLAHLGGFSKFKGIYLIRAALQQSAFENLELTVVDYGLRRSQVKLHIWGKTPVRVVGPFDTDEMAEVYATHDVLLAPSLWPEPFGLVTREALAAGLWVIAGNRGAIGDDVKPGVNGWIVDVGTIFELKEALREIERNPKKYLQSPPYGGLRSAKRQAEELMEIYEQALASAPPAMQSGRFERRNAIATSVLKFPSEERSHNDDQKSDERPSPSRISSRQMTGDTL